MPPVHAPFRAVVTVEAARLFPNIMTHCIRLLPFALLSGCLSVDIIPQAQPSPSDASADAADADAEAAPEDAGDAGIALPDADLDASDEDAEADAEIPVPAPITCEQGVTERCIFDLRDRHGSIAEVSIQGDYVYWLDLGSMDARNNYLYDGAIMRTQIGSWQREALAEGLDFYDEDFRWLLCNTIRSHGDYVFWGPCDEQGGSASSYLQLSQAPRRVRSLPGVNDLWKCVFASDEAYCQMDDEEIKRRDLTLDGDWQSLGVSGAPQAQADNTLYFRNTRTGVTERLDLTSGLAAPEPLTPNQPIWDVLPGKILIGDLGGWIGVARDDGSDRLVWRSVAGPGHYLGTHQDWIYWWEQGNAQMRLNRTRMDGSDQTLWAAFEFSYPLVSPGFSSRGVLIDLRRARTIYALRFEPLPSASTP
jgi:hypothetical protein